MVSISICCVDSETFFAVADLCAKMLEVPVETLKRVLISRSITTGLGKRASHITIPLELQQASDLLRELLLSDEGGLHQGCFGQRNL